MKFVPRHLSAKLRSQLKLFPVVVVVGPRQSGKTTFIKKELSGWKYFDMEKPSDHNRLSADIEFFLNEYGQQCIIDEAQELPELFPALRSFIDSRRSKKGQIVLLSSVNPILVKNISETLAGRIGFLEISPFTYSEVNKALPIDLEKFWLYGGYPESLEWKPADHSLWLENYVKTFVERDVFKILQTSLSSQKQTHLLSMLAHVHGKIWNASQIASSFGINYHTINTYIEILETYFLIRRILPYHRNIGKRLIKRPKLYFRDTGLVHFLLGITSLEDLRVSPYRGCSFEGFIVQSLIQKYYLDNTLSPKFYYYRTSQGDEIDLLVETKGELIAYEIKTTTSIDTSHIKKFNQCLDQLDIKKGIIVYFGKENYQANQKIDIHSAFSILGSS